jgi:hypothetical protein
MLRGSSKYEDSDFPFVRQIQSIGWAEPCLLLTSSILQANQQEETLHHLQAVSHFPCSQSLFIKTLDCGKNASLIKLIYTIAQGKLDQIAGEETKKLGKISVKKALSYVDDTLPFLQRQRRKYCDAIETTPVGETPPSVYLNRNGPQAL